MKLHQIIEHHRQQPQPLLKVLLWPLSRLFQAIYGVRRYLYHTGRLKSEKLPVPVAVVGNIHAGGTGKTPVVAALVRGLQAHGVKVGIISRGYGRKSSGVHVLEQRSTAAEAGDEPLLLYRRNRRAHRRGQPPRRSGQSVARGAPRNRSDYCG